MFAHITLSKTEIDLINKSPTLVSELLMYNAGVIVGTVNAIQNNLKGNGVDWDPTNNWIEFGTYCGQRVSQMDPAPFIGTLAHEIGHYINNTGDLALQATYASQLSTDYLLWSGQL